MPCSSNNKHLFVYNARDVTINGRTTFTTANNDWKPCRAYSYNVTIASQAGTSNDWWVNTNRLELETLFSRIPVMSSVRAQFSSINHYLTKNTPIKHDENMKSISFEPWTYAINFVILSISDWYETFESIAAWCDPCRVCVCFSSGQSESQQQRRSAQTVRPLPAAAPATTSQWCHVTNTPTATGYTFDIGHCRSNSCNRRQTVHVTEPN